MFHMSHDEALPGRQNIQIAPSQTETTLLSSSDAVEIPITHGKVKVKSAVSGAKYDLPDGEYPGQRLLLVADVSGSGTCVASTAALAKLARSGLAGQTPEEVTALTFDADNEYAVLEWTGSAWNILYSNATVTVNSE